METSSKSEEAESPADVKVEPIAEAPKVEEATKPNRQRSTPAKKTRISTEKVMPIVNNIFEMNGRKRKKFVEDGLDGKVKEILETL